MARISLSDLKFIEDPKNRKAFLLALREVEEEGFDISEVKAAAKKVGEIEKSKPKASKKNEDLIKTAVGSTPAERAFASAIKKRNFTNTNAVDMKDYKYWRDPDFGKPKTTKSERSFAGSDNSFMRKSMFENDSERVKSSDPAPRKHNSLYDELFGSISKDHVVKQSKKKDTSDIYKLLNEETYDEIEDDILAGEKNKSVSETRDSKQVNKYQTQEYKDQAKERAEKFKKRLEAEENRKKEQELFEKEQKLEKERKELQAKRVELEALEAEAKANEKKAKIVVEVVAPEENVEKPKKTTAKKTASSTTKKATTSTKSTAKKTTTRKRKKKLDADIKLYKHIVID